MIFTQDFPITVEMLFTIKSDGVYFTAGTRYNAIALTYKLLDCNSCAMSFRKELDGQRVLFYVIEDNSRNYEIPGIATAIVHDTKDPAKYHRLKYYIDSLEGDSGIKDHVRAAWNFLGIDISARGIDFNHRNKDLIPQKSQQTRTIPKIIENLDEQINDQRTVVENKTVQKPKVLISHISGILYRGEMLSYGISLNSSPDENVTIMLQAQDEYLFLTPQQLLFTPENYNDQQTVHVEVADIAEILEDHVTSVAHIATGGKYEKILIDKFSVLVKADRK